MPVEEMHRRFRAMMKEDEAKKPAVSPIPKDYRTVTPYLIAQDGPALLEFTKQAFGAEEMFRTVGSAGGLHAEARIGDSMLMLGGGIPGRSSVLLRILMRFISTFRIAMRFTSKRCKLGQIDR